MTALRPERGQRALNTLFFMVLMMLALSTLWPIYRHPRLFLIGGIALAAGCALALFTAARRRGFWASRWLPPALLLVGYLVIGAGVVLPSHSLWGVLPTGESLLKLLRETALSWKRLLTVDAPVGAYQGLLIPPFLLLYFLGFGGLLLILRARRTAPLGVAAPLLVLIFGILAGVSRPLSPIVGLSPNALLAAQGGLFLVIALVWLIWRERVRRGRATAILAATEGAPIVGTGGARGSARSVLAGALVVAVGLGAAAAAVAALPADTPRLVLRDSIEPPFDTREYAAPLSSFRAYFNEDRREERQFTVSGLPAGARIRVATLDTYDGVFYRAGYPEEPSDTGDFRRVPYRIDQPEVAGETERSVEITIDGYRGVWLPTAGRLIAVDFYGDRSATLDNSFFYNRGGGTAAVRSGVAAGDSYRLDALLASPDDSADLSALRPGPGRMQQLDEVPPELRARVREWTAGVTGDGAKLAAVVAGLREGYISHGGPGEVYSRSGHALDRMAQFLGGPRLIGDAEQYAVAAALLAEQLGFPARVVFGFLPSEEGTVTGEDVTAWTEVSTREGWVALDATPEWREVPEEDPLDPERVSHPLSIPPPPAPESDDSVVPYRPDGRELEEEREDSAWLATLLTVLGYVALGLVVLLILASPILATAGTKFWRRRARRRREDPRERIAAGWEEAVDLAVDRGAPRPGPATRREYALSLNREGFAELAREADRAIFDLDPVGPERAQAYWDGIAATRERWDRSLSRWARLRAWLSPRSLGKRRVRAAGRRERPALVLPTPASESAPGLD